MLYLLDKNVRTVRWNGDPLHEATSAIVKESINGDFILTVKYPISDTGIYKRIKEDMLIKCPTPVLGPQLFRIKKPVENNENLEITAYHITDDIMQRSVKPVKVANQTCSIALSQMVQNAKTDLGDFSFTSDIQDRRTFNMTETENIYSVLLDGKHSIVGTWEGELVRDNFALTVKKSRGENRGIVITTHKNLKDFQRTKNSQNVVTRIHAKSTFKPEGAETETTIKVTVDSPLINSYPYINEKEYENNNAKTVEELKKWAQAKFTNEGIDKVSDSIKLEAYELDGQIVHLGDTVNLKSLKHNVDIFKKAVAYEYDGLKEEYISLEFDDKAGFGGSGVSNGLSDVTNAILGATYSAQEIAIERAARNADLAFEHQSNQLKKEVEDGIELIKAKNEEDKRSLSDEINRRFHDFSPSGFEEVKANSEEALKKARASEDLAKEAKIIANDNLNKLNDNETTFAEYKQSVSERIANLASQMTSKANQVEFQRVRETAQLYERILGNTDNGIADNVARMALTNQLFQVEVAKNIGSDLNYLRNSNFSSEGKFWNVVGATNLGINYEHSLKNHGKSGVHFYGENVQREYYGFAQEIRFLGKVGEKVAISFELAREGSLEFSDIRFGLHFKKNNNILHQKWRTISLSEIKLKSYTRFEYVYEIPVEVDSLNVMFYGLNGKTTNIYLTDVKIEKNSKCTVWTANPQDITENIEATRTQVTQLAGSWSVQNINSAGDIINGINVAANGNNRIIGRATHISGETLIDNAVIKSAMIDKLKTANFEAGSVTTTILGAEAVTAEKVKFDAALIQKLVSQQAFINELFAKQATITQIQSIDFTGNNIRGGKISSLNSVTDFDLQTGWIDMNKEAVGIRNRFPGKPMQFLIFGQGSLNGVNGAYTQLMSNRNGVTGIEHTSAGIQIWNGKQGENIQTAITFYGKLMDFMPNSLGGGITVNTENRTISNLDNIYFRGTSLATILDLIDKNFIGIEKHFKHNKLGAPGRYTIRI